MANLFNPDLVNELVARQVAEEKAQQSQQTKPEGSKLAHLAWLSGAGADAGTTAYFQSHPELNMTEGNPLISWAGKAAIPVGAGLETAGYLLARKFLKPNHPTAFNRVLMGMGALHGVAAASNLHGILKAKENIEQPPFPGAVKQPDGSWIDPNYFGKGK